LDQKKRPNQIPLPPQRTLGLLLDAKFVVDTLVKVDAHMQYFAIIMLASPNDSRRKGTVFAHGFK
jgi:hypothetical protein